MPKRKRLFTPIKKRLNSIRDESIEVKTARGRLQGALMDVLEPAAEDSDESWEQSPSKRDSQEQRCYISDEEERQRATKPPQRQSYVLKLFDRSVDLSQFSEDTPLYPICRAWIANQPKADYSQISTFYGKQYEDPEPNENSVELPGPEGPPLSKIPELLPEQLAASKDNINLNYHEAPPPTREQLLQSHAARWASVRAAWQARAARAEDRYDAAQQLLNKINVNAL